MNNNNNKRLYKSETDKKMAGVCAGLADYLGLDATLVRLAFALAFVFWGFGLTLYIILYFVLPKESEVKQDYSDFYVDEEEDGWGVKPATTKEEPYHLYEVEKEETEVKETSEDEPF